MSVAIGSPCLQYFFLVFIAYIRSLTCTCNQIQLNTPKIVLAVCVARQGSVKIATKLFYRDVLFSRPA